MLTVNWVDFDQNFVFFVFHSKTNQQFLLKLKNCDIESFFLLDKQKMKKNDSLHVEILIVKIESWIMKKGVITRPERLQK